MMIDELHRSNQLTLNWSFYCQYTIFLPNTTKSTINDIYAEDVNMNSIPSDVKAEKSSHFSAQHEHFNCKSDSTWQLLISRFRDFNFTLNTF